jgi:hypothetical protein
MKCLPGRHVGSFPNQCSCVPGPGRSGFFKPGTRKGGHWPDLVCRVQGLVIRLAGLPHLPEDFQPALAEAGQGGGVIAALGFFLLIVRLRPDAKLAAQVRPQMHGVAAAVADIKSARGRPAERPR